MQRSAGVQEGTNPGVARTWPPYHWLEHPEILPIADNFWNPKFDESDVEMYNRFLEILRLSKDGHNGDEIGRILHMNNVRKYLTGNKMSFLTKLRAEHDRLGSPKVSHEWLPLRLKPRGTPSGSWVQVPKSPLTFKEIDSLIQSLPLTVLDSTPLGEFGFGSVEELRKERTNLFGFFLGATVGDGVKHLKGVNRFVSRRIALVLSKNKPNSFRFGEFTTLCANAALGLEMRRISDLPISDKRYGKTECYAWATASSPLNSWIFNECLGLEDGETTTYDAVRMNWLLESPRSFAAHFIQGLSESDGWPDAGADKAYVVSSPNTVLFKALLENLGCHPRVAHQKVELLVSDTEEAFKLPFFSPRIGSNLYEDLKTLAKAERYPERIHLPQSAITLIQELAKTTTEANELCIRFARTSRHKISSNTVRKYTT
jgi:hypothetical protein